MIALARRNNQETNSVALELEVESRGVARKYASASPPQQSDWHLREWLALLGRSQAQLCEDLDLPKSTVSILVNHGRYHRDWVSQLSAWLGIEPYELLLPPPVALKIRAALSAAAGDEVPRLDELRAEVHALRLEVKALKRSVETTVFRIRLEPKRRD